MRLPALVAWSLALSFSIYACSDDPSSSSSGTGGSAGKATGGKSSSAGASSGGKANSAGTSAGGKSGSAGSAVGGYGEGGTPEGGLGGGGLASGDAGEAGMGGAPAAFEAHAHIDLLDVVAAGGAGAGGAGAGGAGAEVTGTVDFDQVGAHVVMTMRLESCPAPLGAHAMHFHDNNVCGDDGAAAGPHWGGTGGPGEGGSVEPLGTIACFNAGAEYVYSPPDGTWTIGGDAATNILNHVMVLHAVGSTAKIACGLPELVP